MRILCDCPGECSALPDPEASWRRVKVADLSEEERNLWQVVSADNAVYVASAKWLGEFHCLAVIRSASSSQFTALCDAMNRNDELPSPCAVLALEGRNFRGQRDRSWIATRGNIHLSVFARPSRRLSELGAGLSMLPVVSVVDAVRSLAGSDTEVDLGIKWVNDVWMSGRKVAGVLSTTHLRGNVVEGVVFGVGVNVEVAPEIEPTPFVPRAGCLADELRPGIRWSEVVPVLLRSLQRGYDGLLDDGPDPTFRRYQKESLVIGQNVDVVSDDGTRTPELQARGVVTAIDEHLSLEFDGGRARITRGRLVLDPSGVVPRD